MNRIYLDYAATTPLLAEARDAMLPWLKEFGNPSSLYEEGRRARDAVDRAREVVSGALGCLFGELTFTSSGTEAINQAIIGMARARIGQGRDRILIGTVEHHCALETIQELQRLGYRVDKIPVDGEGRYDIDALASMVDEGDLLVVAQHANNELGTVQPVAEMAEYCKESGALFLVDAVQTFPFGPRESRWSVEDLGADMLAISAHKCYGPKGVGALYVKGGVKPAPLIVGGGQEREMRAGTENVAGIVGFGAAVEALLQRTPERKSPRGAFLRELEANLEIKRTVSDAETLPGHAHIRIAGVDAETMLIRLDRAGVAASSGAACSSGALEPSHVMLACGYPTKCASEGLRFTFGIHTTTDDAIEAAGRLAECAKEILSARS